MRRVHAKVLNVSKDHLFFTLFVHQIFWNKPFLSIYTKYYIWNFSFDYNAPDIYSMDGCNIPKPNMLGQRILDFSKFLQRWGKFINTRIKGSVYRSMKISFKIFGQNFHALCFRERLFRRYLHSARLQSIAICYFFSIYVVALLILNDDCLIIDSSASAMAVLRM